MSTMDALLALEDKYTKVGRSLLPIFFHGELRSDEAEKWDALKARDIQELQAAVTESWTSHAKTYENL